MGIIKMQVQMMLLNVTLAQMNEEVKLLFTRLKKL